jgi:hypothetical protein
VPLLATLIVAGQAQTGKPNLKPKRVGPVSKLLQRGDDPKGLISLRCVTKATTAAPKPIIVVCSTEG